MKRGIFNNFIDDFEIDIFANEEEDCFDCLKKYRINQNLDFMEEHEQNLPDLIPELPAFIEEINHEYSNQLK
jgi:hypothetical protein